MSFYDELIRHDWQATSDSIVAKTESDVRGALAKERLGLDDFKALISPAAAPFLEEMAQRSMQLTQKRFGKTIQLYIPLYLSNYCTNGCVYCGFNCKTAIGRKKLNMEEIRQEIEAIKKLGYSHILLVSGEAPQVADADYFLKVLREIGDDFSQLAIEVQPLQQHEYEKLAAAGLNFVCIYQETYNREKYGEYHPFGSKADFRYRLETPDRLGRARIHKIGLACLLGLEDWRTDSFFTAMHLHYLEKTYWRTRYSISLPRLQPHAGGYEANHPINDRQMVQLICAYRLFAPEMEISISTREGRRFRDNVVRLGATSFSAGSSTEPGGYANPGGELEQFTIDDDRSPAEVAEMIRAQGYEPVWKDWDSIMTAGAEEKE
ncbi:2-iminoacetate synthase ThiH [Desulfosediminicola ganghwensis]|uniref:2-iminoacetate synthase ThiH n=1 Tax=Desulfosediminicola ganghwensis TaxID=2569540 RepID=UPI0010AD660E|nr:2-iminoacetate synthase ThiH [Desulfosediminicola ganghwensis]